PCRLLCHLSHDAAAAPIHPLSLHDAFRSAYFDTLDTRLQKQFRTKLLGIWPFGPQIMFCRKPVDSFAAIKGLKVRTYDQSLAQLDRKSTRLNSSHVKISYAVFCLKKKNHI